MGFDNTFFDPLKVFGEMEELIRRNQCKEGRLRLNVFRNSGGFYKPLSDQCSYLITIQSLTEAVFSINDKGLRLGLYSEIRKPLNALSGIKSSSALLYVMAARHARESGWDDALILNEYGRICECSASNIFLLMPDKTIVTPALSEGILPGVMRKNLIRFMRENEMVVEERIVMTDDLFKADEIFLSNAIQGIRWVLSFRERRYFSTFSRKLAELMQQELIQAN
jgi:branched-chain amino acid aminotransferase